MTKELPKRKREKGWLWIDRLFYHTYAKHTGVYACALYSYLCSRANDQNQIAFPSIKTIAKDLAISEKSVKNGIKILARLNIIKKIRRGKKLSNQYLLLDKSVWLTLKVRVPTDPSPQEGVSTTVPYMNAPPEPQHSSPRTTNDSRYKDNYINDISKIKTHFVFSFIPKNSEEDRAKEIAIEFRERTMDFLLSVCKKYGISLIERARGMYYEEVRTKTIDKPAAYLNSIIQRLIKEQEEGRQT